MLPSSLPFYSVFEQECGALYLANGDAALTTSDFDKATDLYSVAIDLNPASYTLFANHSKVMLGKMLWEDALFDAQKV